MGLAGKSNIEKIPESITLLEKSLKSSNSYIRQAAAEELANLFSAGTVISEKTLTLVKKEASSWWAAAFDAVDTSDKEKALRFLLGFDQNAPIEARNYVINEFSKKKMIFDERELAAIDGHFAILNLRYNEALLFFRSFQENGSWPQNIPYVFLEYQDLIVDLGRAFQYTSYGMEGLSLFLRWENNLQYEAITAPNNAKYRLNFYAARIARRNGQNAQAISLFEKALTIAPDTEQSQACIWYILDLSLSVDHAFFIRQLEKFIPSWDKGNYFNDILENFLQINVSRRGWKNIIQVFNLIKDTGASARAAYAWIIARCIAEGFLSSEEKNLAAQTAPDNAFVFTQIAYNSAENDIGSFLYYRSLSANSLGKPLLEIPEPPDKGVDLSPAGQFLHGFFSYNVPEYSMYYIRQLEENLPADELRIIAASLEKEGMYIQSIQLVMRYVEREGHIIDRTDMELLFPRPYMELVDIYAAEIGIAPQILFGLIRTESAFQSNVVSSAGAVGLTQLMPDTAMEMAARIRRAGGPDYVNSEHGLDLSNPLQNIHIGAYYLNYLTDRFDNILFSLLAYNGGMNRVRRLINANSLPVDLFLETISISETRDYGRKVMAAAAVYEHLYYSRRQE